MNKLYSFRCSPFPIYNLSVPPLDIFTLQLAVIDVWSYITVTVNIKHFSAKQLYMEQSTFLTVV